MEQFPDVEKAVGEILSDLATVVTATGEDITEPTLVVNRVGGGALRQGYQDNALVEVAALCATRPESVALTNAVRQRLVRGRMIATSHGLIDRVGETTAPMQIPDLNPDVRRIPSTWEVISRIQEIP
jgi:hypothetical protein